MTDTTKSVDASSKLEKQQHHSPSPLRGESEGGLKILVTGAKGFVGRNLCAQLKNIQEGKAPSPLRGELEGGSIFEYDLHSSPEELDRYCREADFVFNLAGVNRPENPEDFKKGNFGFASTLLDTLKRHGNTCPVMLSSSIQATLLGRYAGHPYGESKKAGEELFFEYAAETGAKVLVYRFPNLFGKWCRPNYNSAVATFCNNIANDLPIQVNDPSVVLELLYIDDLVEEMLLALQGREHHCEFDGTDAILTPDGRYCAALPTFKVTLGEIVRLLNQFADMSKSLMIPSIPADSFDKRLFSTYLSYLPKEKAIFDLKMNVDNRGSFTELVKTGNCGQVSINISKPGITKGQHWHHTKWEQFIVVKGHGLIQMRKESPSPALPAREGSPTPALPAREGVIRGRMADPAQYGFLKENAKRMRNFPTDAEKLMWDLLRDKKLDSKFRRQHIIGNYIADFVELSIGLIIEVDGGYHTDIEQRKEDLTRCSYLMDKGFSVLRFTNDEVLNNPLNVITIISNALQHLKALPPAGETEGASYFVSGDRLQSVIMLPGYTHNIINLSDTEDLVTVMYCNEVFDPNHPDTFFDPV